MKELNFHSDNVKIVCSQNNDKSNLKKLQEVNPDYVIAQPDSPAKKLKVYFVTNSSSVIGIVDPVVSAGQRRKALADRSVEPV